MGEECKGGYLKIIVKGGSGEWVHVTSHTLPP